MTRHEEVMQGIAEWRASIDELREETRALDREVRAQFGDEIGERS